MFYIWHYERSEANTAFRFIFHDHRFQFQWAVQTSSLLPTKKLIVSSYHVSIHPQCNASFLLEIEVEEDARQSNTDQSLIKWMLHYVFRLWSFQEPSYVQTCFLRHLWRFVYSDLSGNNWLYQPKAKQSMHDHTAQRPLPQLAFWRVYLNNAMVDPDFFCCVGWMDRESSGAATVQRCMQRECENYLCI